MTKRKSKKNPEGFKDEVFSVLKAMKITPKGYFPFADHAELVGSQVARAPYRLPTRVSVLLSFGKLDPDKIKVFDKASKDTKATKSMVFGIEESANLDVSVREGLDLLQVEYFGPADISRVLSEMNVSVTPQEIQKYKNASDVVHPNILIDGLSELALRKIPVKIKKSLEELGDGKVPPSWEIFEDAVFSALRSGLGYAVRQLGKETRFEENPEGVVAVRSTVSYGILYDCKSADSVYTMTADDERTYANYISEKKLEVQALDKVELRYFVVVGPKFAGDQKERRNAILAATGVLLVYLRAESLAKLAKWASTIDDPEIKKLINIGEIFSVAEDAEVQDKTIDEYIKKFEKNCLQNRR